MRYAAPPSSDDRRPKNLLSVFGFPCAMIDDFCRLAPSLAGVSPPQSRPILVVVVTVRGRFRKEGGFLKLVACGHDERTDGGTEGGREEVPHTNRTHARLLARTPPAKPRPARASERAKGRVSAPAIFDHAAAPGRRREGRRDGRTGGRPLAQVIRLPPSPRCTSIRQSCPDGVRRETSTCGDCARTEADFSECHSPPRRSFPLPDFLCGRKDGPVSDPHRAKK